MFAPIYDFCPPLVLCPCYLMHQQLSGTHCPAAGYKKFGKWFLFKSDLLHFSREKKAIRGEYVSAVLSPLASSLPHLCFLLCRRASSNDLPPFCRAPSAWLWAEAICRLYVPVTSAPMGTYDYFCSLFQALECEPVFVECCWCVE